MRTYAQVIQTSVNVITNSQSGDPHPEEHTYRLNYDMTPGSKPFTVNIYGDGWMDGWR